MCAVCGPDRAQLVVDHSITHPFTLKPGTDLECSTCDRHVSVHPDKMEYLRKRMLEQIVDRGHQVRMIVGDAQAPSFAYSVGRCVYDRPEILVTGPLAPGIQHYIVNRVAELDTAHHALRAGDELEEVLEGYRVRLVAVRDLDEAQMFGVTQNFGSDPKALQVLWPDPAGHFPGEPGFDASCNQPVYGDAS